MYTGGTLANASNRNRLCRLSSGACAGPVRSRRGVGGSAGSGGSCKGPASKLSSSPSSSSSSSAPGDVLPLLSEILLENVVRRRRGLRRRSEPSSRFTERESTHSSFAVASCTFFDFAGAILRRHRARRCTPTRNRSLLRGKGEEESRTIAHNRLLSRCVHTAAPTTHHGRHRVDPASKQTAQPRCRHTQRARQQETLTNLRSGKGRATAG